MKLTKKQGRLLDFILFLPIKIASLAFILIAWVNFLVIIPKVGIRKYLYTCGQFANEIFNL